MTVDDAARIRELQDHAREVADDRDAILAENKTQTQTLARARDWLQAHGRHPPTCEYVAVEEGPCTCGLQNLLRDLT